MAVEENKGMENLSSAEQERIVEILAAAKSADWDRFSFLTDKPFSNITSMKEQFSDSSDLIINSDDKYKFSFELNHHKDGSRLIFAKIIFDDVTENPITLTLHSTSEDPKSQISIWTFYQEINFS